MFGFLILAVLLVFVGVVAYRTSKFQPKAQPAISEEAVSFDKDGATAALAELVKCKTISYSDSSLEVINIYKLVNSFINCLSVIHKIYRFSKI